MKHKIIVILVCIGLIEGCSFDRTFFPLDERPDDNYFPDQQHIVLRASDGKNIDHVFIKPQSKAKATILVFHGSGSKVENWVKLLTPLVDNGFQLFLMEYRGFGHSEGVASHTAVASDAEKALQYLVNLDEVKNNKLLVLGQSYGGQLAMMVTLKYPDYIDALITEGAFTSFQDIAVYSTPWFGKPFTWLAFRNPYNAKEIIKEITIPKLIIHSKDDETVPFFMGKELYELAGGEKGLWEIRGKHTDALVDYPDEFVKKVNEILGL